MHCICSIRKQYILSKTKNSWSLIWGQTLKRTLSPVIFSKVQNNSKTCFNVFKSKTQLKKSKTCFWIFPKWKTTWIIVFEFLLNKEHLKNVFLNFFKAKNSSKSVEMWFWIFCQSAKQLENVSLDFSKVKKNLKTRF